VTFTVDGIDAATVQRRLSAAGLDVSVPAATSAQFDLPARGIAELVRASVHYYNTDDELGRLCHAVRDLR